MLILFVDDDPILHGIMKLWLNRHQHEMVSCLNGREACDQMRQQAFDVLITDVNMPMMNGIELVNATCEMAQTPELVIMLTSRCDLKDLRSKLRRDDIHLFNKPFSPQSVIDLIAEKGSAIGTST